MNATNPVDNKTPSSIAAIWSMMLPGLGQMLKGQVMPGIIWGLLVSWGYFSYFWPGITFHIFCILDAAFYKDEGSFLNLTTWQRKLGFLGVVALLLSYVVFRNMY